MDDLIHASFRFRDVLSLWQDGCSGKEYSRSPGSRIGRALTILRKCPLNLVAHERFRDDPNDFRKAVERLWDERDSLIERHPNRWVSMGKDGIVSIGDSIEEVVSDTEAKGVSTADVVIELLDPEPEALIL